MQIVVKTSEAGADDAGPLIRRLVLDAAPKLGKEKKTFNVSKVFPKVTSGNRARIYTVSLPDDVSEQDVGHIVDVLGKQNELEYAQLASPKQPLGG
jgi:hypothetical protein